MHACNGLCMATKTISLDMESYSRLRDARLNPDESFSQVIKRAEWKPKPKTFGHLLNVVHTIEPLAESALDRLEAAQLADHPPENSWGEGENCDS